jgi:hypothetical protein
MVPGEELAYLLFNHNKTLPHFHMDVTVFLNN